MILKEKAIELVKKFKHNFYRYYIASSDEVTFAKIGALISVENEYYSLREQLFNLRSCGVIENDEVYLFRLQELIDEEKELKIEINKL